jgi:O-antigen ligase
MTHHLRLAVIPAYLLLCLLLGGASNAGFWSNMVLQLLAIAIIAWAVLVRRGTPMPAPARQLLVGVFLLVLLFVLQLAPLPPSVWTGFPGRQQIAEGFELLKLPIPWAPISMAPYATISSALWLLPAVAVLLGILRIGAFKTSWVAWVIALVATFSVLVGALQIVGGNDSPWYFYRITNYGSTTGFFSNSNHMATLLVCAIPFLTALYLGSVGRGRSSRRTSGMFVILAGAVAVTFAGVAINGSLAGVGLVVPVAFASFLMIWSRKRKLPGWVWAGVGLLIAGAIVLSYNVPFSNNNLTGEGRNAADSRQYSFAITSKAAADFFPVGSGIGTFVRVFHLYEDPATVDRYYMNHAHSDYLELALETGLPGLLLLLIFFLWWARRAVAVWRSEEPDYYARAASIASAAILAHSIVDYPLRTVAISAVFAVCCAFMAEPRASERSRRKAKDGTGPRHLSAD